MSEDLLDSDACWRCCHTRDAHTHLHDRTYCGLIGCGCRHYKGPPLRLRMLRALRLT